MHQEASLQSKGGGLEVSVSNLDLGRVPTNGDLITIDPKAYRSALIQIDYLFEELEALGHRWSHLESCTVENCERCNKSRQIYRRMLVQINEQLRNLLGLLTRQRIAEVLKKELEAHPRLVKRVPSRDKPPAGAKRFDLGKLNHERAYLDSLWRFGNQWKRLGDFNLEDCRATVTKFDRIEQACRNAKTAFREIESALERNGGRRVEDVLAEKELEALFRPVSQSFVSLRLT